MAKNLWNYHVYSTQHFLMPIHFKKGQISGR